MQYSKLNDFLNAVYKRDPNQPEYLQAVKEVMTSLWPFIQLHPEYASYALLERLTEPERIIQFRVVWIDDKGQTQVNRAFRVQHNNAIGPYKGGMRFHPSVNLSVLKFLAFEQTFKNALTTLPMGGGKGGSDFDPKGKSDTEVMRFCQALISELYRHIGSNTDVPAGDIGVGAREIGYMTGYMKKLANDTACTFTGKGLSFGGSLLRPEATGYGVVYFAQEMLAINDEHITGKTVTISGAGNVAQFAAQKLIELGAKVITLSDSDGTLHFPAGLDNTTLLEIMQLKNIARGRLSTYAALNKNTIYYEGKNPWHIKTDIAMPCATQNELDLTDATTLLSNGCYCVVEGANMPTTLEAAMLFIEKKIAYAPGKASNAGGVATSGLEMSQDAVRLAWTKTEVDKYLKTIMQDIHQACVTYGKQPDGSINYVDGANIAGFVKLANAMLAQGVY